MANKVIQLNDGVGNNLYPAIVAGQNKPSVDTVIERGTYSSWNYQKWASGRFTATRKIAYSNIPFVEAVGGGYIQMQEITLPTGLIEPPLIWGSPIDSAGFLSISFGNIALTKANPRICRHFSYQSMDASFALYLEGRWK